MELIEKSFSTYNFQWRSLINNSILFSAKKSNLYLDCIVSIDGKYWILKNEPPLAILYNLPISDYSFPRFAIFIEISYNRSILTKWFRWSKVHWFSKGNIILSGKKYSFLDVFESHTVLQKSFLWMFIV